MIKRKLIALIVSAFMLINVVGCGGEVTAECTHQWGEWQTTTQASCTSEGAKQRKCSLCEETESDTIAILSHDWASATCIAPKTCKVCALTEGEPTAHVFNQKIVKASALKSEATCTSVAVYYYSCNCGQIGDTETFTRGSKKPHSYTIEVISDETLKSQANCTSPALYYYSCECGDISVDEVFEYGTASHFFTQEIVKEEAVKTLATAENTVAVYYKSCVCGLVGDSETFELKTMTGKNIIVFGDSYSSYAGTIPDDYRVYYSGTNVLSSPDQMWWSLLTQERGGTVVRNDSSSGSTINTAGYHPFINRLNKLYSDGFFTQNRIDYVFVLGGTNDNGGSNVYGEEMYEGWTNSDLNKVLPAICYFFTRLREILPEAEIYGIINAPKLNAELENAITNVCNRIGGKSVMLHDISLESSHPNEAGMIAIKNQILEVFDR